MFIRKLQRGDEEALTRFLLPKLETSMFILGNVEKGGLDYHARTYQGEYLAAFSDATSIEAVAVHYWSDIIMAQANSTASLQKLLREFRSLISRPVLGIVGDANYSLQVVEALGLSKHRFALYDAEDIYTMSLNALSFIPPDASQPFRIRPASEIDSEVMAEWYKAYDIEALNMDDDQHLEERVRRSVEERAEREHWVLLENAVPVSLSGFNARAMDALQVGPVWTPPPLRNKGYARMLVAWTLYLARQQGMKKALLFTNNPAAARAYQSIGFRKGGQFRLAILKQPAHVNPVVSGI